MRRSSARFHMTDRLAARWSQANERYLQENIRSADVTPSSAPAPRCCAYILQSEMLGIWAYLVVAEQGSDGIMIASSILMGRASAPVENPALGRWSTWSPRGKASRACATSAVPRRLRRRRSCCRVHAVNRPVQNLGRGRRRASTCRSWPVWTSRSGRRGTGAARRQCVRQTSLFPKALVEIRGASGSVPG